MADSVSARENPHGSAESVQSAESKSDFVQSFLACFKSLPAYLKHYRPFRCIEYINAKKQRHKFKPLNLGSCVIYSRRLWTIPFVMVLATGVVPRSAAAQNNAPAISTPSADEAFRKGLEAAQRKDYPHAMPLLRQAAEQGDYRAQELLGVMYMQSIGVKQDYAQGLFWTRKAADQGDASAQSILGTIYMNGEYGVKQDYAQALPWLRKAAEQGNADAQRNLGYMYGGGKGVTPDLGKAIEWTQKAAAQGHVEAQKNLEVFQRLVRGPSDNEIIQAVKDRIRHDAIESIKAEYAGVDKVTTDNPFSIFEAKSKAAVSMSLACSLDVPKDRQPCLDKMRGQLLAERAARLKEMQDKDLDAAWVYSVQEKTSYEGNYVSFVNFRQRGSDKTFRWKVLLHMTKDGAWTIAEQTEQAVN